MRPDCKLLRVFALLNDNRVLQAWQRGDLSDLSRLTWYEVGQQDASTSARPNLQWGFLMVGDSSHVSSCVSAGGRQ